MSEKGGVKEQERERRGILKENERKREGGPWIILRTFPSKITNFMRIGTLTISDVSF